MTARKNLIKNGPRLSATLSGCEVVVKCRNTRWHPHFLFSQSHMASNKIVCDLFQNFLLGCQCSFRWYLSKTPSDSLLIGSQSNFHQSWWFWAAIGSKVDTPFCWGCLSGVQAVPLLLRSKMGWGDSFNTWNRYAHCRILHEKMKWIESTGCLRRKSSHYTP